MKKYNLAYFVSHPIQYQAPLLRMLGAMDEIDLKVFFISDFSVREYKDTGFGTKVEWDVPLTEGYQHCFLKNIREKGKFGFLNPLVIGVRQALKERKWDAVWFHGYAHYSLLWGILLAFKMRIPIFFRGESTLICTGEGLLKNIFKRWLVRSASALLWVGTANKEYYREYGAQEDQLFFTPYAVNNSFFQQETTDADEKTKLLKKELGLEESIPVVLYASKWIKRKNPLLLLEAFADTLNRGVKAYLVFVGDGELRKEMTRKVEDLALNKFVKLLGFKNQTELPAYYALCDVFVLPSNREPFGLVINEVMNAGKAIITTDEVGAAKDLVKDGVNGFIFPAGDKNALCGALSRVLSSKNNITEMGLESIRIIADWNYAEDVHGIMEALRNLGGMGTHV